MLKKLISSFVTVSLAALGATVTNSSPAVAAGTVDTGVIYYVGAWNMGNAQVDPYWTGIRRLDLASGEDARIDLETPSCAGLAGSSTSGLAVDLTRKRLYWTANDGSAGVFAMDLTLGTCYTLQSGGSPRGVVVSDDGLAIVWSDRVYNPNSGVFEQEIRTVAVADLDAVVNNVAVPGSMVVAIPGYHDISISDLEMKNGRMYALMNLTNDIDFSTKNFIYSYDPSNLADPEVLEADTGVIGSPYQFQIGADSYFVSTGDQIYRVPFGNSGATWGMMLNQISGFALVGDNIYSAFNRDEPMKVFNPNTDANPRALDANPPVDMFSYLVYAPAMPTPTITAASADSANGTVQVPFSGVTLGVNEVIGYAMQPRDGSAPFGGICVVQASKCVISGLDDSKIYDATLRYAFTYQDPNDPVNQTHVIMSSGPSNQVQVNHEATPPPPPPSNLKSAKTFTGFEFEKGALTAATKKAIKAWVTGKTGYTKVTCVGYTGYNYFKRSNAFLNKLALKRATNVCNYIHALNPSIVVTSKTAKKEKSQKSSTRRVIATITN